MGKSLNVLFVCSRKPSGSGIPSIGGKGLSSLVFSQGESLKRKGVKIDYFIVDNSLINKIKSIFKLKRKLKNKKYNIIHAHYGFTGIIAKLSSPKHKLIVSFMGGDLLGLVDRNGHFSLKSKLLASLVILFGNYFTHHNIVKSKNLGDRLKMKKTSLIPNGIDLSIFYPMDKLFARRKLNIPENKSYILFGSNPKRPEKNYKLFSEAINNIKIKNLKIGVLQKFTPQEVMLHLNACDVMVLTSYYEGSPNVVKEALACNCPIVSTDVGDVKNRIKDIENSFVCDYDSLDLSKKIAYILKSKKRSNGLQSMSSLDINIIAKRILNVYYKLEV